MATSTKQSDTDEDYTTKHRTVAAKVKVGDIMALIDYVKVTSMNANSGEMHVQNLDETEDDGKFMVQGKSLIENGLSADQYHEEQSVTKTKAAEILVASYNRPFTVQYVKQPDKPGEKGEVRTLRGRLIAPEPLLGRSKVEDLDIDKASHRIRLVDHRTIKFIVVEGVKYTVK